jgi:DNA-binding transcriptional MerR regulator
MYLQVNLDYNNYLRVGEAAKLIGVDIQTLRRWDKAGKLKPYRHPVSNYRLYMLAQVNKLLEDIKKGE